MKSKVLLLLCCPFFALAQNPSSAAEKKVRQLLDSANYYKDNDDGRRALDFNSMAGEEAIKSLTKLSVCYSDVCMNRGDLLWAQTGPILLGGLCAGGVRSRNNDLESFARNCQWMPAILNHQQLCRTPLRQAETANPPKFSNGRFYNSGCCFCGIKPYLVW